MKMKKIEKKMKKMMMMEKEEKSCGGVGEREEGMKRDTIQWTDRQWFSPHTIHQKEIQESGEIVPQTQRSLEKRMECGDVEQQRFVPQTSLPR